MEEHPGSPTHSSGGDSLRASYAATRKRFLHARKLSASHLQIPEPTQTRAMRLIASIADKHELNLGKAMADKHGPGLFHRSASVSMLVGGPTCTCGQQFALNAQWFDQLVKCRGEKEAIEKELSTLCLSDQALERERSLEHSFIALKEQLDKALADYHHKEMECQAQIDASRFEAEKSHNNLLYLQAAVGDYEAIIESMKEESKKAASQQELKIEKLKSEIEALTAQIDAMSEALEHLTNEKHQLKKRDSKSQHSHPSFDLQTKNFQKSLAENNLIALELQDALTRCEALSQEVSLRETRIQEVLVEKTKLVVAHRRDMERQRLQQVEDTAKLCEENRLLSYRVSILENKLKLDAETTTGDLLAWKPASPSNIESPDPGLKSDFALSERWIEDYVFNQQPFNELRDTNREDAESNREGASRCHTPLTSRSKIHQAETHRQDSKYKNDWCDNLSKFNTQPKQNRVGNIIVPFQVACDKGVQVEAASLERRSTSDSGIRKVCLKKQETGKSVSLKDILLSLPSFSVLIVALFISLVIRYRRMTQSLRRRLFESVFAG
jgi:hypothetical protein